MISLQLTTLRSGSTARNNSRTTQKWWISWWSDHGNVNGCWRSSLITQTTQHRAIVANIIISFNSSIFFLFFKFFFFFFVLFVVSLHEFNWRLFIRFSFENHIVNRKLIWNLKFRKHKAIPLYFCLLCTILADISGLARGCFVGAQCYGLKC